MNNEQAKEAYRIGEMRTERHIAKGTQHRYGLKRSEADFERDGLGALAEATVADMLGLPWNSGDTPDKGVDVGDDIGVRHSKHRYSALKVYPSDLDHVAHVLVVGEKFPLRVVGWIMTGDAKRPEYWREHGVRWPAYFVPQSKLHPMSELVRRRK